jgi:hypothetical protein
VRSIFDHIYRVDCPCEITDSQGNLLYVRASGKSFIVPLSADIRVKRGRASLLGVQDNFYGVNPLPLPQGWSLNFALADVPRKAEINIDYRRKKASAKFDRSIFEDKGVPEGCKIFMFFHELGHLIFGPDEAACDEYAFWHALRAGVSPFLCYVAIRHYMPQGAEYRIERLGQLLLMHPQLRNDVA